MKFQKAFSHIMVQRFCETAKRMDACISTSWVRCNLATGGRWLTGYNWTPWNSLNLLMHFRTNITYQLLLNWPVKNNPTLTSRSLSGLTLILFQVEGETVWSFSVMKIYKHICLHLSIFKDDDIKGHGTLKWQCTCHYQTDWIAHSQTPDLLAPVMNMSKLTYKKMTNTEWYVECKCKGSVFFILTQHFSACEVFLLTMLTGIVLSVCASSWQVFNGFRL